MMTNPNFVADKSKKFAISIFMLIIGGYLVTSGIAIYRIVPQKNPILTEKLDEGNYSYLFDFYVVAAPKIDARSYYGSPNADITLTAFLDIDSQDSIYFIKEIFPRLDEEFIKTGKLKFFIKNYLTIKDYEEKNDKFKYAIALSCISQLKKEAYYNFYFDVILALPPKDLRILAKKYNISNTQFSTCLETQNFREVMEDMVETENFGNGFEQKFYVGFKGTQNTVIDGVPSYARFRRIIRNFMLSIGA